MSRWVFFFASFLCFSSGVYPEQAPEIVRHAEAETVSLEDLSAHYEAFFLDAYGVFWGSNEIGVLPGAAAAMEYLVSQGKYVGILTNSTQLAAKEKNKLRKHGLYEGIHYHFLLTSGEVARELLEQETLPFPTPRRTYWVFGDPHPRFGSLQFFEGTKYRETSDLEEADFIHLSVPHIEGIDQEDPEVFREKIQAVGNRIPVLCVNPDRFAMEGSPPRPVVRQGSIARLFADQNAPVYFIGKPSQTMYAAALRRLPPHVSKEKILMVGDTPETDIRGAHGAGLDAALVTKTGVASALFAIEGSARAIERFPQSDRPEFLLERLGLRP